MQKVAFRIILKGDYREYTHALSVIKLPTLEVRRANLLQKFAVKCVENPSTSNIFEVNTKSTHLRHVEPFKVQKVNTTRMYNSAIPAMTRILNSKSQMSQV